MTQALVREADQLQEPSPQVSESVAIPTSEELVGHLRRLKIVPVITIDDPAHASRLASALSDGGLPCAEVTFRTPAALEALRRMTAEHPDMLLGAGTVLTVKQAAEARAAGAKFLVAPGFNPVVVEYCLANGMPVFPGVCTPTEIEGALGLGLNVLKFFPAEPIGGIKYLKAIAAPYTAVQFMPTGGVTVENIGAYLAFPRVVACGGSWMAPPDWIAGEQFDRIRDAAKRAVEAVGASAKVMA
jgi:2-dehydro-3-deoxyphosphogluconate aldolase/(4S)-4-hydroxy-2-oxoglutarate aldolase